MYRTLLVDDREIFILELKRLKLWGNPSGFQIAGKASSGVEALELLRAEAYDLVITDIRMPKLDGIGLLRQIKAESLCPCVVLFSEYSEFEYARKGLVLGAFDYLVKPAGEEQVASLLARAAEFLASAEAGLPPRSGTPAGREELLLYPLAEEKALLSLIGTQDGRIAGQFAETAARFPPESGTARRLYLAVTGGVFEKYPWLSKYAPMTYFEQPPMDKEPPAQFYSRRLSELTALTGRLLPAAAQGVLLDICFYILGNPEADISLSAIAEKFYTNHTYLSNTFRQKTGRRFNDYVTSVRMARARYLLEHSEMKIYEISGSLGYRDVDYFNRLFKKHAGVTPTECRKSGGG